MVTQQWTWATSDLPPAPLPAQAKQEHASGPVHCTVPSAQKALCTKSHATPSLTSFQSLSSKNDSTGHSVKQPQPPYQLPLCLFPALFLFEVTIMCHTLHVYLFIVCHQPHPTALKCQLHDRRDFVHFDHHCVPTASHRTWNIVSAQ